MVIGQRYLPKTILNSYINIKRSSKDELFKSVMFYNSLHGCVFYAAPKTDLQYTLMTLNEQISFSSTKTKRIQDTII